MSKPARFGFIALVWFFIAPLYALLFYRVVAVYPMGGFTVFIPVFLIFSIMYKKLFFNQFTSRPLANTVAYLSYIAIIFAIGFASCALCVAVWFMFFGGQL